MSQHDINDQQLDREWIPSGRPQSIVAQNFAVALDQLFNLNDGLANLSSNVEQKKKTVSNQHDQLKELDAKIKETEKRLRHARSASQSPNLSPSNSQRRTPMKEPFTQDSITDGSDPNIVGPPSRSPLSKTQFVRSGSRPVTSDEDAVQQVMKNMPGALPPTPGYRDAEEYVFVERLQIETNGDENPFSKTT